MRERIKTKKSSGPDGFTLVELLVVMAIIAMLLGCLMPMFTTVRERSRQVKCVSNLKQLAMAFYLYADEHEGLYPPGWDSSNTIRWHDELLRYLSSVEVGKQVLVCPTARVDPFFDQNVYKKNRWNAELAQRYTQEVVLAFDGVADGNSCAESDTYAGLVTNRHDGVANYLFGDGHVVALAGTQETNWVLR